MCGRFTQAEGLLPGLVTVTLGEASYPPRYNGAPSQDFWVVRRHPETGECHRDRLVWGLIPHWVKDADGGRKPIIARSDTIGGLPTFRAAYAKRRCLIPIDNFFEWQGAKGQKGRRPYAIGMKDGRPFALAGIWESWTRPGTGEIVRTFAIVTTDSNELVGTIHDRMPVIVAPENYDRWLSTLDPDPRDLMAPYPSDRMKLWPISAKVNRPENDTPDIRDPIVADKPDDP